jgi:hypothetical protein
MYWLIENQDQLECLYNKGYEDAYIEVISFHPKTHPAINSICAFYIRPFYSTKGFITSIVHNDTYSLDIDVIIRVIMGFKTLYVRDKKEFLHYITHPNIVDLTLASPYKIEYTKAHEYFYNKHPNLLNINCIIPIVKHYEYCEKIYEDLKDNINKEINIFYNNKISLIFNAIERQGIKINIEKFEKYFYITDSEYIYTQYNFKTTTTRPSNHFNNINYAALNKENHERSCFIPRNDIFVEFDISAYHPTLLAKLIKHDFNNQDVHSYFAELYNTDYKRAKELTFKQLYGGIFKQYKDLEFFKKTQDYIDALWNDFQNQGYIICPISNHKFYKDQLENMNPHKLLNYLLQNLETSHNALIMWDILILLKNTNTKLIHYCYDSFLFDLDKDESHLLLEIKNIFDKYKLRFKLNTGVNYDFS